MIITMEEYALDHNLKFSTDPDPIKCKTKCMAYLKSQRELPSMILCDNPLPWVRSIKHLGVTVTNVLDGCQEDVRIKRGQYINRCNEVLQEFHFADSATKTMLNSVYNSHFTGSPCWDLTGKVTKMLEASFNRNIKITYDLPYPTHRNLLPTIANVNPLIITLAKRLLTFVDKLKKSNKPVLNQMIKLVENDVRTVTGRNLRNILLLTDAPNIGTLRPSDLDQVWYYSQPDMWRVLCVEEILTIRGGVMKPPDGWSMKELDDILEDVCCN